MQLVSCQHRKIDVPKSFTSVTDRGRRALPGRVRGARRSRRALKMSELIARDIVLDISAGGLKSGDLLPPEASMLQQYEVGRASLREALRLLEVQGLVHIRAGAKGGPVVGAAMPEHLARMLTLYFGTAGATYEDLADVVLILYPKVAEIAAGAKLGGAEIAALNATLDRACSTGELQTVRDEALADFHSLLATFSRNSPWTLLTDAIGQIFSDHVFSATDSAGFHAIAAEDHRQIADAILAEDPASARRHMLEHTRRMIEFCRARVPGIFSRPIEWR